MGITDIPEGEPTCQHRALMSDIGARALVLLKRTADSLPLDGSQSVG